MDVIFSADTSTALIIGAVAPLLLLVRHTRREQSEVNIWCSIFLRQTGSTLRLLQREMAAGRIVIILYLVVPFTVWTVADNICVDNCSWRPNGYYQSCYGCDVFTSCDRGHLNMMKCPENTVWDDALKSCLSNSQTCMEVDASAVDKGLVKYTGYGFTSPSIQVDQSPRRGALSHYGGFGTCTFTCFVL
ncbi:hypothetical protein LSAT2_025042 [Lamellibrachia satsuma]|nr:hypothetical protein LSAT2_025042 [Lamellibrachia satsuma]